MYHIIVVLVYIIHSSILIYVKNFIMHVMYELLKLLFDIFGCSIVVPSGSSVVFTICCTIVITIVS